MFRLSLWVRQGSVAAPPEDREAREVRSWHFSSLTCEVRESHYSLDLAKDI